MARGRWPKVCHRSHYCFRAWIGYKVTAFGGLYLPDFLKQLQGLVDVFALISHHVCQVGCLHGIGEAASRHALVWG